MEHKDVKTFADVLKNVQYSRLTFPSLNGDRWITISANGYEVWMCKPHGRKSIHLGTSTIEAVAVRIAMEGIEN